MSPEDMARIKAQDWPEIRRKLLAKYGFRRNTGGAHDYEQLLVEIELELWQAERDYDPAQAGGNSNSSRRGYAESRVKWRVLDYFRTNDERGSGLTRREARAWRAGEDFPECWKHPIQYPEQQCDDGGGIDFLEKVSGAHDPTPLHAHDDLYAALLLMGGRYLRRRLEAVYRYYVEEQTGPEIAAALGISLSRVFQLRDQGLAFLRKEMSDTEWA